MIAIAVVIIVIIIGSVFAYTYISSSSSPSPSPSPAPTASPTAVPTSSPTAKPTSGPTATPTAAPTASPTPVPTPTPTPAPLAAATVNGGGGTLVYPLMQSWVSAYGLFEPQIQVNYNSEGSGAGILDFNGQRVNFGESDLPLQTADIAGIPSGFTALTVPISASAVVPAYNIPITGGSLGNGLNFTGSILAQIFLGTITNWNDPQIAAINPGTTLPDHQIITVHRSDGSGTMFAFTDYLSQASTAWANGPGKGKLVNWPNPGGVAQAAKGNGGVALAIIQNAYSIGPLEIAYEIQNSGQISYGTVQNAAGNWILASASTNVVAALQAGASSGLPAGNNVNAWANFSIIDNIYGNASATTVYPITTLTYALIFQDQHYGSYTQAQGAATVNFLQWVVNQGQSLGPSLGYAPLSPNIVALDNTTLRLVTYSGTAYLT